MAIKVALENDASFKPETIPARFPTNLEAVIPLTFRDYVTSVQAPRLCEGNLVDFEVSGILDNQNPFLKCDSRTCQTFGADATLANCEYLILAVAPQTSAATRGAARMQRFKSYVESNYPEFNSTGHYAYPMVQSFTDEKAIEDYVTASDYGSKGKPKVAFSVIFPDGTSDKDYAYTLRMNSTNFNIATNEGRPATRTTPATYREFDDLAVQDNVCATLNGAAEQLFGFDFSCTYQYIFNGAVAIQRLVDDWIIDDTGSASLGYNVAEHGVQFVSFPSKEFVENGFYAQINRECC